MDFLKGCNYFTYVLPFYDYYDSIYNKLGRLRTCFVTEVTRDKYSFNSKRGTERQGHVLFKGLLLQI